LRNTIKGRRELWFKGYFSHKNGLIPQ
jgi:hypothetical protein